MTNAPRKSKKSKESEPSKRGEFVYKAPNQSLREGRPSMLLYASQLDQLVKAAELVKAFMIENGYQHD